MKMKKTAERFSRRLHTQDNILNFFSYLFCLIPERKIKSKEKRMVKRRCSFVLFLPDIRKPKRGKRWNSGFISSCCYSSPECVCWWRCILFKMHLPWQEFNGKRRKTRCWIEGTENENKSGKGDRRDNHTIWSSGLTVVSLIFLLLYFQVSFFFLTRVPLVCFIASALEHKEVNYKKQRDGHKMFEKPA